MFNWVPHTAARSEKRGAGTGTTFGTTITGGASANTKGSYTDIGATTSFDYEWIVFIVGGWGSTANFVVDLAINVGGNRFIIAEDLRQCSLRAANEAWNVYQLPIH